MDKSSKHPQKHNKDETKYNRLNFIVASFAVIISCVAVWFSFEQTHIAKDSTIIQLRAYLSTEITGWQGLNGKHFFALGYQVVNHGQTPAKVIQIAGQIEILDYPLPTGFVPKYSSINDSDQIVIVFPEIRDFAAPIGKIPTKNKYIFTPNEISRFTTEESNVRVYEFVRISYIDVFNIIRHTYSCRFLKPNSIEYNADGSIKTFMMANYWKYNNFD